MDLRDKFFGELYKIASKDKNVILLTADLGAHKLEDFKKNIPTQYINIGIAEQNLINVATGLTMGGKKVFCYAIASFIVQRCYEQIKVNLCDMCLPVLLIGMGAGKHYQRDGATHCITYDREIMGVLPNMQIITVNNVAEVDKAMKLAYKSKKPLYIRLCALD